LKVVVAGGAGFIGSQLCARLLDDQHSVLCVDNLLTGSERNIAPMLEHPQFTFRLHDVLEALDEPADVVFHLASPASPVGYWNYPFETIQVNTQGAFRLLELAQRTGARFLMASTSEAYGDPQEHPQPETYWGNVNTVGPRSCYDESKRLGETITKEFHRRRGVDVRIVRIFNTYGPNSQLDDGRFIPNFIVQALRGKPLTVYGTGMQTRSICYVDDLVDGLMRAMFGEGTNGEVFNLGNPEEHSVLEWAQMIIRLCQSSSAILREPRREDDPERRRPDITKAQDRLGWYPRIAPEEGLSRTIAWFRKELERDDAWVPVNSAL
jgi:nucleoside-diphosphate-sugar epimerase